MPESSIHGLERLKATIDKVLDLYHEGVIVGAEAKLRLWAEATRVMSQDDSLDSFAHMAWLRVQASADPESIRDIFEALKQRKVEVLCVNHVGPREPDKPAVLYIAIKAKRPTEVMHVVATLAKMNCPVRDWAFGIGGML